MIVYAYTFLPTPLIPPANIRPSYTSTVPSTANCGAAARPTAPPSSANCSNSVTPSRPHYRGSTGYGAGYYNGIDRGGRDNDDVHAARAWLLERYRVLDPTRTGILGWSYGGLLTPS
ncbi:MAG: prolyl oligopeptidase family serine peptidase [Acidobacteriota bacterium]|jgi:hypothetical protein